ncbi:MAG TPA: hypothetical protein VKE94_06620, partial [Gemmataceae bacterium]|nr:hypothetical protein [Gemmataceae bacterium]
MNTSATLGRFLLEEEGDKLVLREKDQARSLVYIFFGPLSLGFALLFCLGLREELKAPGDIGKFVL